MGWHDLGKIKLETQNLQNLHVVTRDPCCIEDGLRYKLNDFRANYGHSNFFSLVLRIYFQKVL